MRYVWFLLVLLCAAAPAQAETRALIVASTYTQAEDGRLALANPNADALLMQSALRDAAVDSIDVLTDPSVEEWEAGFSAYIDGLNDGDIALFYFAGHGFQVNGQNYFLTSDGRSLVSLDSIMQGLTARARGVIVVVDACRSNPFASTNRDENLRLVEVTGATRQLVELSVDDLGVAGNGLAQLGNLRGLSAVVFFSTEPGNVAEDGDTPGLGSPFAKVFSEEIARRQSLDEAFRRTAVRVNEETKGGNPHGAKGTYRSTSLLQACGLCRYPDSSMRKWIALMALAAVAACDVAEEERLVSSRDFPRAYRPVSDISGTSFSTERVRDDRREAATVMDEAQISAGMTVADIGAGEGYYTVRLAARVGERGRVLANDIDKDVLGRLGNRVERERLDNVSIVQGDHDDPKLPRESFDRVFMVHMYHQVKEPYAFLWRMRPSLRDGGQVVVVNSDRPVDDHGIPPQLLFCEFERVGYRLVEFIRKPQIAGYYAQFEVAGPRPEPRDIEPCVQPGGDTNALSIDPGDVTEDKNDVQGT